MRRALVVLYAAGMGAILVVAVLLYRDGEWKLLAPVGAAFSAASAGFVAVMRLIDREASSTGASRLLLTFLLASLAGMAFALWAAVRLM